MKKAILSIVLFLSLSGSFYNTSIYPPETQPHMIYYSEVEPGH